MNIGFIGLGLMGAPMARNLAKAGHALHVWSRRPQALAAVAKSPSYTVHESAAAVAAASEVVFTMVADSPDVHQVILGENGVGEGGKLVYDERLEGWANDSRLILSRELRHSILKITPEMAREVVVTFTAPGAYGIKCAPHLGMGMIGLVVVGNEPVDLDALQAVKLPKKAQERMTAIIDELGAL